MRIYASFLLLAAMHLPSFAASPEVMTEDEALQRHLLITATRPHYSYEALARRKTGSGIFDLRFDYDSGRLREVHVERSTGDRYLDGLAIDALKLWIAKPRAIHILRVPVTFTFSQRGY